MSNLKKAASPHICTCCVYVCDDPYLNDKRIDSLKEKLLFMSIWVGFHLNLVDPSNIKYEFIQLEQWFDSPLRVILF